MKGIIVGLMAMAWAVGAMADGNDLLRLCRSAIQIMDRNPQAGTTDEDLVGGGRCHGLIEGTVSTVHFMDALHEAKPTICIPGGVKTLQVMKVVVKFLEANPKFLNLNESGLVLMATKDAFPCKT